MNIVINIDKNYVGIASVMLYSLASNSSEHVTVYVLNDELDNEDFAELNKALNEFKTFDLVDTKVDSSCFPADTSTLTNRWSKTVFYRLLISELLPKSVERVLYLDTDIIVDRDIQEMYHIDLGENYIAACIDTEVSDLFDINRLNLNDAQVYFNSGVILFDLKKIRDDNIMNFEIILDNLRTFGERFIFPDQDLLNVMYSGKVLIIEYRKYNFMCARSRETSRLLRMHGKKAAIFHYGGERWHRPWNVDYVGKFGDKFWKYALNTPYGSSISRVRLANKCFKPFFIVSFDLRTLYNKIKDKIRR